MKPSEFQDIAAERGIMAGIVRYGSDAFVDVDDLIMPDMIRDPIYRDMYVSAQAFFSDDVGRNLDYHSLISTGRRLGLGFVNDSTVQDRWRSFANYPIGLDTVRREAAKIYRLDVAKRLDGRLAEARRHLHDVDGTEPIERILTMAEEPVFGFAAGLGTQEDGPTHIAKGGREWLEWVIAHPQENIGIPSPFGRFNTIIGGGFRRKTVSFVAARRKSGKTILCDNICIHVARMGIPVLNIDTEMTQEEHLARIIAYIANIDSNKIERGHLSAAEADECRRAMDELESIPYHYQCITEQTFSEQLASLRRWAIKEVGADEDGRRKDCLVIYDWLQMEDPARSGYGGEGFKEYQILFFQVGALQTMAKRCDLPILAMGQLNREGGIAASDRVTFKVSSYTTLHRKDESELSQSPEYPLKMIVEAARHGPGSMPRDYINIKFDGATAHMQEGPTRYELDRQRAHDKGEFQVDGDVGELAFA
jgi:replicative DNA helicase